MGNVVVSLISFGIMLFGVFAIFQAVLGSAGESSQAWMDDGRTLLGTLHARVAATEATASGDASGTNLDVTVTNVGEVGQTPLGDWTVNVEYINESGQFEIKRIAYSATQANNAWNLQGIYLDASALTPADVEPDVLNAGEEMVMRVRVAPPVQTGSTVRVTLAPPSGDATSIYVTG